MSENEIIELLLSKGFTHSDENEARIDGYEKSHKKMKEYSYCSISDGVEHNVNVYIPSVLKKFEIKKFYTTSIGDRVRVTYWGYNLKKRGEKSFYDSTHKK